MMPNVTGLYKGQYQRSVPPKGPGKGFCSLATSPFGQRTSEALPVEAAPPPSSTGPASEEPSRATAPFPSSSWSAFSYSIVNEFSGQTGEGEARLSNPPMQPTMPVNTVAETSPLVTR